MSLGFEFAAEHEIPEVDFEGGGTDPRWLRLYESGSATYLMYLPFHFVPDIYERNPADLDVQEMHHFLDIRDGNFSSPHGLWNEPHIACAWATDAFIVGVRLNDEAAECLRELDKAFQRGEGRAHLQIVKINDGFARRVLCLYIQPIEGEIGDRPFQIPKKLGQ